jgi:hypothetical protein
MDTKHDAGAKIAVPDALIDQLQRMAKPLDAATQMAPQVPQPSPRPTPAPGPGP